MDPLSITASVITLADAIAKVYRVLQSIHHADAGYNGLCTQLETLAGYSRSIARILQNCQRHPMALAPIDEDVWKQSRNAIRDSQQAIDDLNALVKRIGGPVINVSISLRGNASQTLILRELEQLNQYLEISTRATADNNPLFELDKSDIHVLQNLKNLVRAAGDFHASARSEASTIFSGSHLGTEAVQGRGYAQSILQPTTTVSKRRHLEMFFRQTRSPSRMNSLHPSVNLGSPRSVNRVDYPEVVADEETGLDSEDNLDSTLSGGFSKMAQKALRKFDFPKAEKILQQALDRHKISAPDDAHHSRLRTQLAVCSFLQGKGSQIGEAIIDLAEFRGTKRPVAYQLLYNLALSHIHDLDSESAHKICLRLWSSVSRPNFPAHLKKNDLLRLLVVSYRMSDKALFAEAIEEEYPELASLADDALPSMLESVISCEELLVEFLGVNDNSEIPRLFIHQLRSRAELANKSPFELKRVKQRMQKAADPGRPTSEFNDRAERRVHTSLRQTVPGVASGEPKSSSSGRFTRIKTLLKRRHSMIEASLDHSQASVDTKSRCDVHIKTAPRKLQKKAKAKRYVRGENDIPLWQRISPWHRRMRIIMQGGGSISTDENGERILCWMRGQDQADSMATIQTASSSQTPLRLRRSFSFTGMPPTPRKGRHGSASLPVGVSSLYDHFHAGMPITRSAHVFAELPGDHLVEMMDTSSRARLRDTRAPVRIVRKPCPLPRSRSVAYTRVSSNSHTAHEIAELPDSSMPKRIPRKPCSLPRSGSVAYIEVSNDAHNANEITEILGSGSRKRILKNDKPQERGKNNSSSSAAAPMRTNSGLNHEIIKLHGYYGPECPPRRNDVVSQISCLLFPNALKLDETKRSRAPVLIPNPNPKSLRRKGPCLYQPPRRILTNTKGIATTKKSPTSNACKPLSGPVARSFEKMASVQQSDVRLRGSSQGSGYEFGHVIQSTLAGATNQAHRAVKAVRSRQRLFSNMIRVPQQRDRDQKLRKSYRMSIIQARLRSKIHGFGEDTSVAVGNRLHRHGMVYEYLGPAAIAGPYTVRSESPRSLRRVENGAPHAPDNPGDIRVPVELDSRPIEAIRCA